MTLHAVYLWGRGFIFPEMPRPGDTVMANSGIYTIISVRKAPPPSVEVLKKGGKTETVPFILWEESNAPR